MFAKLKNWFKNKYLFIDDVPVVPTKAATQQSDIRTQESIRRFRKSFQEQEAQMQERAMKSHDPSCKDVLACKKRKCFKWESDKIVSKPYNVPPRT